MQAVSKFINTNQKLLIRLMAALFFLAPLANIFFSFLGSGVEGWSNLNTVGSFLKSVPWLDFLALVGFLLVAVTLLINKSLSLYLAAFILIGISLFGVLRLLESGENSISGFYLSAYVAGGTLINILAIAFILFLAKLRKSS